MRIVLKDKPGQRQQELADEEKEWLRKHLDSANTFLHKFRWEKQIGKKTLCPEKVLEPTYI